MYPVYIQIAALVFIPIILWRLYLCYKHTREKIGDVSNTNRS